MNKPSGYFLPNPNRQGDRLTAKEKVLELAPEWTEAQATAALRAVQAQSELAYFQAEAQLTPAQLRERENRRADANALIREPW